MILAEQVGAVAPVRSKRPPRPGYTRFHRPFHKEVGYQRRKILKNCDTVAPLRSIDYGYADEESVRALPVSQRSPILWREVRPASSRRPRNKCPSQMPPEWPAPLR